MLHLARLDDDSNTFMKWCKSIEETLMKHSTWSVEMTDVKVNNVNTCVHMLNKNRTKAQ